MGWSYEKFIKASPSHPCPICGGKDWCGFNSYLASCMRDCRGSFKTIIQSDGNEAYQHKLTPGIVDIPFFINKQKPATETAPVTARNRVYKDFLSLLSLNQRHRDDLLRRGLSERDIKKNGYKSIPEGKPWNICGKLLVSGHDLSGIPGFYKASGPHGGSYWTFDWQPGYFIPVLDGKGRIQALQRRMDDPSRGGKYKLFSGHKHKGGCSCGTPAHVARPDNLKDRRVWITEGPLKADIASKYLGAIVIGALSATTWKPVLELAVEMDVREVVIAYDMDTKTNWVVARAEKALTTELLKQGFEVQRAEWKTIIGKGIDDALVSFAAIITKKQSA